MKLRSRFDNLGCSQASFAAIAVKIGPLSVRQEDVSRWLSGNARPKMLRQLEQTLMELENLRVFYGVPLDLSDSAKVAKLLIGLRDIRSKVAGTEVPSAMHATFAPGGNVARVFGTPTDGVVENALTTEEVSLS